MNKSITMILLIGMLSSCCSSEIKEIQYSNVTCSLTGLIKEYKHVQVHDSNSVFDHTIYFEYNGKEVRVQDTYCIVEDIN